GVILVGSRKIDFPALNEALLLDVAANQVSLAILQARFSNERNPVSSGIDRLALETRELASANRESTSSDIESRRIIDSIPGLVLVLTAEGDVELVSRQLSVYFGRTSDELRQWGTSDAVHPEDLPQVIEVFKGSIASGSPYEITQRLRRSD